MAFTPSKNEKRQNSACNCGTILAFSENQRQSTFHSRRKAPFLSPKTARTAGRSGRSGAEKRQAFSPASPLAALFSAGSCLQACFFCVCCFRNTPCTSAQRPVFWCLAGTRSAVSGKPHKPPTRARRRGTRCRSQLHLLYLLRFRHFRLRIGGNRVPLTILGFPRSYKLLLQQFFC